MDKNSRRFNEKMHFRAAIIAPSTGRAGSGKLWSLAIHLGPCRGLPFRQHSSFLLQFLSSELFAMYAIILDGGRQFKVEEGQELTIDFRDLPAGEKLTFDKVLAISTGTGDLKLGAPTVAGASVAAEVIGADKGEKLVVQKFRRRKNSRRKTGHRSVLTRVKIGKITG